MVVGIEKAPQDFQIHGCQAYRSSFPSQTLRQGHQLQPRYAHSLQPLDVEFPNVTVEAVKDAAAKKEVKKAVRKTLEEKYKTGQNKWFFQSCVSKREFEENDYTRLTVWLILINHNTLI